MMNGTSLIEGSMSNIMPSRNNQDSQPRALTSINFTHSKNDYGQTFCNAKSFKGRTNDQLQLSHDYKARNDFRLEKVKRVSKGRKKHILGCTNLCSETRDSLGAGGA